MLRKILFMLAILATTTLTGCLGGYGYGLRPSYYGGGYGYAYRAPIYRAAPVFRAAPSWGVSRGGGYRGGVRGRR